jgi:hypothetical protein
VLATFGGGERRIEAALYRMAARGLHEDAQPGCRIDRARLAAHRDRGQRGEDSDDRENDHHLGEREAALVLHCPTPVLRRSTWNVT